MEFFLEHKSAILIVVGAALFIVLIGGIPGLRLSLPTDIHDRIVKKQVLIWATLIAVIIVWQKLT